jgi:hypothetical protein
VRCRLRTGTILLTGWAELVEAPYFFGSPQQKEGKAFDKLRQAGI